MVIGYRAKRADAWHRRFFAEGYVMVMNVLFGMHIRDIDCAFKLFRKSAWRAAQPITSHDHKMFSVEWLWNSTRKHLRIKELPAEHYPRLKGVQTGARPDVIVQMLKALFRLRFGGNKSRV